MANYASGKHARAISDRSGMEFPHNEMVREWNGALVHVSEFEPKQPQLEPKPHGADAISLQQVRVARTEPITTVMLPQDPFTTYQAGSGIINVYSPGHGLTNIYLEERLQHPLEQALQLILFLRMAQFLTLMELQEHK